MVQVEGWLGRRDEEIAAWVATDGVVTGRVDAIEAIREVTLHVILEGGDVLVVCDEVV